MRTQLAATAAALALSWPSAHPTRAAVRSIEPLGSSESLDTSRPYWRRNFFRRVLSDQKFLVTTWAPAETRRPRFFFPFTAALIAASQSGSGGPDARIERSLNGWADDHAHGTARAFSRLGDAEVAAAALGGTYLISRFAHADRMSRASSLSAEALVNAGLYSSLLKRATRRTRPSAGGTGAFFVTEPEAGQETTSFPSGHATGAFAVASVFAGEYRDKRWVPWVAYGTAGLIGASRVAVGRHFPTDVLAGAVLGQSIGRMVVRRDRGDEEAPIRWNVEPLVDPESAGVGLTFRRSW